MNERTITAKVLHETENYTLVDYQARQIWLPTKSIEVEYDGVDNKTYVTMPEWLAEKRGI